MFNNGPLILYSVSVQIFPVCLNQDANKVYTLPLSICSLINLLIYRFSTSLFFSWEVFVKETGHLFYSTSHSLNLLITSPGGSLHRLLLSPVFPINEAKQEIRVFLFLFFGSTPLWVVSLTSIRRCMMSDLFL